MKKIDMHIHAIPSPGPERLRHGTFPLPSEVRSMYDQVGIEKGVLMPLGAPEHMHDPITSRMAEELHQDKPDTIGWWFCYLDPRMGRNDPGDDLSYYVDYFRERGASGVGEMQANIWIDDPRMVNLFRACEKGKLPVTVHFGKINYWTGVADEAGLPRLENVLTLCPDLLLLGHAQPFWAEFRKPENRVAQLMRRFPNLYCDLSANSGFTALTENPEKTAAFFTEFSERCVFGTDFADPKQISAPHAGTSGFLDWLYEDSLISLETYTRICRTNALEILDGTRTGRV